VNKADVIEAG